MDKQLPKLGDRITVPLNSLQFLDNNEKNLYNDEDMSGCFKTDYADLPPIQVSTYRGTDGKIYFTLEDGRHRYAYAKQLGLKKVEVEVVPEGGPAEYDVPWLKELEDKQLKAGIEVEKEHSWDLGPYTDLPKQEIQKLIAQGHLKQDDEYYSKLMKAGLIDEPEAKKILEATNNEQWQLYINRPSEALKDSKFFWQDPSNDAIHGGQIIDLDPTDFIVTVECEVCGNNTECYTDLFRDSQNTEWWNNAKKLIHESLTWSGHKLSYRTKYQGMDISIENRKGSIRRGTASDGTKWETKMTWPYGYIRGTEGTDGDHVDCVSPETKILMGDFTEKNAEEVRVGEVVIGFLENPEGRFTRRKLIQSTVLDKKTSNGKMLRITLSSGVTIETTPGHLHYKFLGNSLNKVWKKAEDLQVGDRLAKAYDFGCEVNEDYQKGYLYGVYLGDGSVNFDTSRTLYADLRVVEEDRAIVDRAYDYWTSLGFSISPVTIEPPRQTTTPIDNSGRIIQSTRNMAKLGIRGTLKVPTVRSTLTEKNLESPSWCRGFLAGLYDTDGCLNKRWETQISQVKNKIETFDLFSKALSLVGLKSKLYENTFRVFSGEKMDNSSLRFLVGINPVLIRKRDLTGISVSFESSEIISIEEYLGEFVALQTETSTFIANGLFTHNCFLGPNRKSSRVFVVHQLNDDGEFDEDKCLLGWDTEEEAKAAYLSNYNTDRYFGSIEMLTLDEFKDLAFNHKRKMITLGRENLDPFNENTAPLLAPNGKPSNLSPYLYKVVRTPQFKAWFGDWDNNPKGASKCIDENGEPLVVYHGTGNIFSSFKVPKLGKSKTGHMTSGIYFSSSPHLASDFAGGRVEKNNTLPYEQWFPSYEVDNPKAGRSVKPCFLRVKNVDILDYGDKSFVDYGDDIDERINEAQDEGYDAVKLYVIEDERDSIEGRTQWIIFDPKNAKAIYNKGSFNPNTPELHESTELNEAKNYGSLYHATKLDNLPSILMSGGLRASSGTGHNTPFFKRIGVPSNSYFISLSRNPHIINTHYQKEKNSNIILEFDGEKLSQKYKIYPFIFSENPERYKDHNFRKFGTNIPNVGGIFGENEEIIIAKPDQLIIPMLWALKRIIIIPPKTREIVDPNTNIDVEIISDVHHLYLDSFKEFRPEGFNINTYDQRITPKQFYHGLKQGIQKYAPHAKLVIADSSSVQRKKDFMTKRGIPVLESTSLEEAKNYGDLYHFTKSQSVIDMFKFGFLLPSKTYGENHINYLSLTRNPHAYKAPYLGYKRVDVGLVFDGTNLSNKYKVRPYLDTHAGIKRTGGYGEIRGDGWADFIPHGESEERLYLDGLDPQKIGLDLLKRIKKIVILGDYKTPKMSTLYYNGKLIPADSWIDFFEQKCIQVVGHKIPVEFIPEAKDKNSLASHIVRQRQVKESFKTYQVENKDALYELFRSSYEAATGYSWNRNTFDIKSKYWTLYGDEKGAIAVSKKGKPFTCYKIVAIFGAMKGVSSGLKEFFASRSNTPIYSLVDDRLSKFLVNNFDMIEVPKEIISYLGKDIIGYLGYGPVTDPESSKMLLDIGSNTAVKYLIGNKAFFRKLFESLPSDIANSSIINKYKSYM